MSDSTDPARRTRPAWHARAGDLLGDDYNMPGIVLCAFGVVALACTLTAAGTGHTGLAWLGAVVTVLLWLAGITALVVEHRREEAIEREYGRLGHAPGHRAPVRYGAVRNRRGSGTAP